MLPEDHVLRAISDYSDEDAASILVSSIAARFEGEVFDRIVDDLIGLRTYIRSLAPS
jgi:hypothetical protein